MEQYLNNFKNCLQKEIPYCAAECPFHIDILDFIEKMKRGGFKGAYKTYRNAVGFPMIVSNLCPEPCKGVCPRREADAPIEMKLLEQACIAYAGDRSSTDYNLPMKKKKVAVIGAGISGLACALRLCMKKYEVEIFEEKDRIGGSLWELMEPDVFLADIEEQFKHENYTLHLNTPVRKVEDLYGKAFDAVYVATGKSGEGFGLNSHQNSQLCALYDGTGWFAGGGLIGEEPIYALATGLHMGTVLDNYLKTGNLLYPKNEQKTAMCLNQEKLKPQELLRPANGASYSQEEAQMEANRCLECQCDFCRTYCDLTDFYNKWPLRIRDEIMATTLPGSAEVKATPAKRLLSTCNQCGLCKETCPEDIDVGGLILEGRKSMHRQKKAPWVFHDFWLRDMEFANSKLAALAKRPSLTKDIKAELGGEAKASVQKKSSGEVKSAGQNGVTYAFFPGCQLGASDPELVERTYCYLQKKRPDTGLLLQCCGAPAEWSGDEDLHQKELESIRSLWRELGQPVLIMACPTCEKKFKTYLQEIPVTSLYEILDSWSGDKKEFIEKSIGSNEGERSYSVFDACASRHEPEMRASVRSLAEGLGYALEPLPENEARPRCCSFGGQPGVANPEYAAFVTNKRISESENPYITFCINCRDVFLDAGKETVHILELLFGTGSGSRKLPTVSQRRENRILLKKKLLETFWGEESEQEMEKDSGGITLEISPELSEKLHRARILEEDLRTVVEFCQRTGRRVRNLDKESFSGYKEVGHTTYWVDYRQIDQNTFLLLNAYAHHMKIELEAVWKGRKITEDQ